MQTIFVILAATSLLAGRTAMKSRETRGKDATGTIATSYPRRGPRRRWRSRRTSRVDVEGTSSACLLLGCAGAAAKEKILGRFRAPQVEAVELWDGAVTADDLRKLAGWHLTSLNLCGRKLDAEAFAVLGSMNDLESLGLAWSSINDAGLKKLRGLKGLRELGLRDTVVNDARLKELRDLYRLRVLNLEETAIGDEGFATVAQFTHLQSLFLDKTKVTNHGLRHLEQLTELEFLNLPKGLSDEGSVAPAKPCQADPVPRHRDHI